MSTPIRSEDGIDDPLIYVPRRARSRPEQPVTAGSAEAPPTAPEIPSGMASKAVNTLPAVSTKKEAVTASTKPSTGTKTVPHAKPSTLPIIQSLRTPVTTSATAPTRASVGAIAKISAARRIGDAPTLPVANAPPMAPGVGGLNVELPPPRLRPFQGDIAVQELRRRLSLDPHMALQPPVPQPREPLVPWLARISFLTTAAVTIALGIMLLSNVQEARWQARDTVAAAAPALLEPSARGLALQPLKMIVESQRAFANEPLPLGIWLNDAAGTETLTMVGLAAGTKLSAGTPLGLTGWQVAARDLNKAYALAPKDFVGVMDAAIDLRSRDRLVDSQFVRLEWVPKKEPPPVPRLEAVKPAAAIQPLDPQEIANLLKRGEAFVKSGDIPSARIALRRAANADNAQAMLALGMTFDPDFLSEQGVLGFAADAEQARAWYEKATRLGSTEASRRLARLANVQ
jgi:hypothetical protein